MICNGPKKLLKFKYLHQEYKSRETANKEDQNLYNVSECASVGSCVWPGGRFEWERDWRDYLGDRQRAERDRALRRGQQMGPTTGIPTPSPWKWGWSDGSNPRKWEREPGVMNPARGKKGLGLFLDFGADTLFFLLNRSQPVKAKTLWIRWVAAVEPGFNP